MNNNILNS